MMTEKEIQNHADEIFEAVRILDNPKDAATVLILAQFYVIRDTFKPEDRQLAIESIEKQCEILKEFVKEGWN